MAKGAEPSLLREQLLVGHGVGEGEGWAGNSKSLHEKTKLEGRQGKCLFRDD